MMKPNWLFERDEKTGLLRQVDPAGRKGRRFSTTSVVIDVLFTAAEEAEADAADKAHADKIKLEQAAAEQRAAELQKAREALAAKLGVTVDELITALKAG